MERCERMVRKTTTGVAPGVSACRVPGFAAGTRRRGKVEIPLRVRARNERTRGLVVPLCQTNRTEPIACSGQTSEEDGGDDGDEL